jgi:hypothetical protein
MAQSSKLMRPDNVGLGGFDSHTLPPADFGRAVNVACRVIVISLCVAATSAVAFAQKRDTTLAPKQKADSTTGFKAASADTVSARQSLKPLIAAPITPRRAFVYSALIPGMGQAALDRKYTGAAFFLIEAMSWALLRRSADDERIAKSFVGDSVPQTYAIDPTTGLATRDAHGNPVVATWAQTRYTPELIRARSLHVEDWVAVILFNHLLSGADAYVAANLWDLPQHLGIRASPVRGGGAALTFSFKVR